MTAIVRSKIITEAGFAGLLPFERYLDTFAAHGKNSEKMCCFGGWLGAKGVRGSSGKIKSFRLLTLKKVVETQN